MKNQKNSLSYSLKVFESYMKNRKIFFLFVVLTGILFLGWGGGGHQKINSNTVMHLPSSMGDMTQVSSILTSHASDADQRKGSDPTESPKHFLDIDAYPEFATRTISHNLDSLILKYTSYTVTKNGTLPWAIATSTDSLTAQIRRRDWSKAWLTAADLGHYVGDSYMPLHCTKDYNGSTKYSGSNGIHSRYESSQISTYLQQIVVTATHARYVQNPLDSAFAIIYANNLLIDSLYVGDKYARDSSRSSSSTQYYMLFWEKVGVLTTVQIQKATEQLANLIYTAWIDAGSPSTLSVPIDNQSIAGPISFALDQNFPNPFNPSTTIRYGMPLNSRVKLQIVNLIGQVVDVLVNEDQSAGWKEVQWNANVSSGLYFYRIEAVSVADPTQRIVLVRKMVVLK
jgi:hypothetical protein